jgi:hypothetical protein
MGMHVSGETMQLRAEAEINASCDEVWQVLTDFDRYPEWNPFIGSVVGRLRPGAKLEVTLLLQGGRERVQRPTLVVFEPPTELRWHTRVLFGTVLACEHFFKLTPTEDGRTRLGQGQNYRGMLVKYMGAEFTAMARGFAGMNQALKRRVEQETKARG